MLRSVLKSRLCVGAAMPNMFSSRIWLRPLNSEVDLYGKFSFRGKTADHYLQQCGLPAGKMDSYHWARGDDREKIAAAVLNWAKDMGATSFCHWFQPLGSSVLRHGLSGQVQEVQNRMIEFDQTTNEPIWKFNANQLMWGETDGSSYNTGGLRATHTAGGYTCIDPTSSIFIRGDTMFIPACFVSFHGEALDEKTPLLRSLDALSLHGAALMQKLGFEDLTKAKNLEVEPHIGLEQEFFLIPREAYLRRSDIQLCGRSILGRFPARGQEACDHYMAPISEASPAMACIQEIQQECYRLGIPLRTRHREVAPNQYELVAQFGKVSSQVDFNVILAQIIEEVSVRHNLAALLHEKPFDVVNGSGKHNNWSLRTNCGANLFNYQDMLDRTGSNVAFIVVMAALIKAVDTYGSLMRLSITSPGNEFRLGACEAPPAIMSVYLGDELTRFLENFMISSDVVDHFKETSKELDVGSRVLPLISIPAQDRNRTSPFPFISDRFEFRAVGSSQNPSFVNTVLATIMAKSFKDFTRQIDAGQSPVSVAQEALRNHWKVIFNGNSYSSEEQEKLISAGVSSIPHTLEALQQYGVESNVALFTELGVFTERECKARKNVSMENYIQMVSIEAACMVDMINQQILPALHRAMAIKDSKGDTMFGLVSEIDVGVSAVQRNLEAVHAEVSLETKTSLCQRLRLEIMPQVRAACDKAEGLCPLDLWPMATYQDLLFLDVNHHTSKEPTGRAGL